jgi:chromosome segregation ATPase
MNHLVQIARRTNKEAIGFKVQLVVHRFNASINALHSAELYAVMTGHKKRAATKSAPYSYAQKEVVWGDILPFSSTLYMAKTGLFQAKMFAIHVYDAKTEQQVAAFEFNLAELVSAVKESGKESITIATAKCQDPRAAISLTIFSSRVMLNRSPGGRNEPDQLETSFDDTRSDFSICTIESRASTTSAHQRTGRSPPSSAKYGAGHSDSPTGDGKADGLRAPLTPSEGAAAGHGDSHHNAAEVEGLRRKNHELVTALQDLETQLRQSEVSNVKLESANECKDEEIRQLREANDELELQVQQLREQAESSSAKGKGSERGSDADDGVMQVDFIQYMTIKEELEAVKTERDELRSQLQEATDRVASGPVRTSDAEVHPVGVEYEDRNSEDEYVDAQEPQLLAEITELKHSLAMLRDEKEGQKTAIRTLTATNDMLTTQIATLQAQSEALQAELDQKDNEITRLERATSRVNEVNSESEEDVREREARRRLETDSKIQADRLVSQLHQLDSVVTGLKDEKSDLTSKLQEAELANERAQDEVKAAKSVLIELEGEKEDLEEKLQSTKQAHGKAKEELVAAEQTIEELRQQVKEIADQLQSTQEQLDTLRNDELAASAAATAAAVAKNQELQVRWDDLRSQNQQLQSRVDELEAQLSSDQTDGEARESELQAQVKTLREEAEALREELEQLCVSKQAAEEELHERTVELREALENQRRLTVDRDERVGALEMSNEEIRTRADEQGQAAEAWQQRVKQLEQENDYFQRELIDSKMKLAELTQQNDELAQHSKKVEKNFIELQISVAEKNLKSKKK